MSTEFTRSNVGRRFTEERGVDRRDLFERVADRPQLLESPSACGWRGEMRQATTSLAGHLATVAVRDPHARKLNVDDVAFVEIDDLIGRAGERHRV
jgi:hypothetical protein